MPREEPDFRHAFVEFFYKPGGELNKRKSRKEGRPVYDQRELVRFRIAGDRRFSPVFHAHDPSDVRDPITNQPLTYAQLHKELYAAFKAGEMRDQGTLIEVMPGLSSAKVSELKALNINSIEALAQLDGEALQRLGQGGRDLKNRATEYLEEMSQTGDTAHLIAANEELRAQIVEMRAQIDGLAGKTAAPKTKVKMKHTENIKADKSPFDEWDDDTIRAYLDDNKVDHPAGARRPKLLELAREAAATNREANAA